MWLRITRAPPSAVDALAVMTQAYLKLELPDLAEDSLRVLQLNYPDAPQTSVVAALVEGREPPSQNGFSLFGLEF